MAERRSLFSHERYPRILLALLVAIAPGREIFRHAGGVGPSRLAVAHQGLIIEAALMFEELIVHRPEAFRACLRRHRLG